MRNDFFRETEGFLMLKKNILVPLLSAVEL